MTNIKINYTPNSKGKYDFVVSQNDSVLYEKTYSPVKSKGQHFMAMAFTEILNEQVERELKQNVNFLWESFDDFKTWAGNPELRKQAVKRYHEQETARVKAANK